MVGTCLTFDKLIIIYINVLCYICLKIFIFVNVCHLLENKFVILVILVDFENGPGVSFHLYMDYWDASYTESCKRRDDYGQLTCFYFLSSILFSSFFQI